MKDVNIENAFIVLKGDHMSNDIELGTIFLECKCERFKLKVLSYERKFKDGNTIFELDIENPHDFKMAVFINNEVSLSYWTKKRSDVFIIGMMPVVLSNGTLQYLPFNQFAEEKLYIALGNHLGMALTEVKYKSCCATFGEGPGWATIYSIDSHQEGQGHAQELLIQAKAYYSLLDKEMASTVALNTTMEHILEKLSIKEYK